MGCSSCSSGEGGLPKGCKNNGACGEYGCNKLDVFDWLADLSMPTTQDTFDLVELRFKNSRKEFYRNDKKLMLQTGDVVAVEASPGHDIGVVVATGELVRMQMKKKGADPGDREIKRIIRKASQEDIEKWRSARTLESDTMFKARKLATSLKLQMKISDVEYQGDSSKATFYYTADDRVDFRQLIKDMADTFKVRIEMRQIGARQEAGRVGGIGSCGRELCCSTWLTDFRSVSTSAARYQQLSLNPQKLAGQCGKLKCCLNYELDSYLEAVKDFPDSNTRLKTKKASAYCIKTDIFLRKMWFVYDGEGMNSPIILKVDQVKEIIEKNKQGVFPESLKQFEEVIIVEKDFDYENVVGQDSVNRFDVKKSRNKKKKRKKPGNQNPNAPRNNPKPSNKPATN
jgi:cell fate regulator YaaT (PSP1 superfamily)